MKIYDVEQGTDEWRELRKGKFTSSNFGKLFTGKNLKSYNDYINTIVFERLTGEVTESYTNNYMRRGTELEPLARDEYELETFNSVTQVGFVELNEWVGGSPDGLVDDDGMIEIKCPIHTTFVSFLINGTIPKDYYWQMQGNLYICNRQWCDYVVYYPGVKPIIKRVNRNEDDILKLEAELETAIEIAKERLNKISKELK